MTALETSRSLDRQYRSQEIMLKPSILTVGKFAHYTVSTHGIVFGAETPRDIWLDSLKRLCFMHEGAIMTAERTLMLLADALNFGQEKFGEEFAQAIDGTRQALGLTPKTVANAQRVYGKIPSSRRRDGLTLGHYDAVATLPEEDQETLLSEALKSGMTRSDFRKEVAERFPKKKAIRTKADTETLASALSKLTDAARFVATTDPALLTAEWKEPASVFYKLYRRNFVK